MNHSLTGGTYDKTIDVMKKAIQSSKLDNRDALHAVRRLARYYEV